MWLRPALARQLLGGIRLTMGTLGLVAPQTLLRGLGTDVRRNRSGVYPFRMFGVRTVSLAADLLLPGASRRHAAHRAVVIHAADTGVAVLSGLRRDLPPRDA